MREDLAHHRGGLWSVSFLGLLVTQFLSIINDNLVKWLVAEIAIHHMGDDYRGFALGGGTAAFVLPFILFASPAGFLADRYSKRNVIVNVKAIELFVAILACIAIGLGSIPLMFATLFLLGTQASLFGPAKLGSIPELLLPEKLSIANGLANLATVSRHYCGTISGFQLCQSPGSTGCNLFQSWAAKSTASGSRVYHACMAAIRPAGQHDHPPCPSRESRPQVPTGTSSPAQARSADTFS
ncbi:MAG: MFS transporter [Planctomycetales bacterium]